MPSVNSSEKTFPLWLQPSHFQTSKALSPCSPLFCHKDFESPLGFCLLPSIPERSAFSGLLCVPFRLQPSFFIFKWPPPTGLPADVSFSLQVCASWAGEGRGPHHLILQERPRWTITSIMSLFLESLHFSQWPYGFSPFSPRSKNTDTLPVCWGPSCHTLAKPPPQGAFQWNSSKAGHSLSYLSCSFLYSFFFLFSIMCIYLLCLNSFYFIEVQLIYSVLLVSVHSNMIRLCTCVLSLSVSLCDPMDCSLASSSAHGILQARILDWVAISSSRGSSRPGVFSYIYISMHLFFFRFFSIIGYYKILNMVPCSNQ